MWDDSCSGLSCAFAWSFRLDKRPNTKFCQIKREKPNSGSSKIRLEEILKHHLGDQEGVLVHECARRHFFTLLASAELKPPQCKEEE